VIDSGSDDRTVEIAKGYPVRLEQIHAEEFHHARTRNFGALLASGAYLVYLTADATPTDKEWLRHLLEGLNDPEVAGSYGRQLAHSWAYPMERYFLSQLYPEEPRKQQAVGGEAGMDTTWFSNVSSAIKRELWERFPFDESSVMTEDQIWSRRVLVEGYSILYNPRATVLHCHNYSLVKAFRRYFDSGMTSRESYLSDGKSAVRSLGSQGVGYMWGEIGYLLRTGKALWVPYAMVYELAKFAGILAGRHHERLPGPIVRALSHNTRGDIEK
jgi:rhamnosyltransferase